MSRARVACVAALAGVVALSVAASEKTSSRALHLPESESAPDSFGCERARPGATPQQCEQWAISVTEGGDNPWRKAAMGVLERLCREGRASSCAEAADVAARGVGQPRDRDLEQRLRDEACRLGMASQCRESVAARRSAIDQERSALARACESRLPNACLDYGAFLWDQDGDPAGLEFFRRACADGEQSGCMRAELAQDALDGRGPW
jgi:hypothetical protein